MKNIKLTQLLSLFFLIGFSSCLQEQIENGDLQGDPGEYEGFDFATVKQYEINIHLRNPQDESSKGVYAELYTANPLNEMGIVNEEAQKNLIFKGISNSEGIIHTTINPASRFDSLYVLVKHTGFPTLTTVALNNDILDIYPGATMEERNNQEQNAPMPKSLALPQQVDEYYVLGEWAYYTGYPYYLDEPDQVSQELLEDINASLPEGSELPATHPQYLSNAAETNLVLIEDAEVWVTFVHEGAGYKNALGYYTYPTGNPPASKEDIEDMTIIFPNASYYGSGGNLMTGDKVQLMYLDPETNLFDPVFPDGITIGWFLIANAFQFGSVDYGYYTHFSNSYLNVEEDPDLQKHNVLLYDEPRELMIIGFEDVRRDERSDEDFNDAVFYSTVTPFTAVQKDIYQPIDSPEDTDNDGVSDVFDDYPEDPDRSFDYQYPAEESFGSLVFEDLWPGKGDYDFNDMVIDYNFKHIANPRNEIMEMEVSVVLRAIGASYKNGFGFSLNTNPENILEITGTRITDDYITFNNNGTEANQSLATIIAFDNAFEIMPHPGGGSGINTTTGQPFVTPDTMRISITFENPLPAEQLDAAPYNPFIIVNQNRGKEVHLPMHPPTDLADTDLFSTQQDQSNPDQEKYYVADELLPWALNIPEKFIYPQEKNDITKAYNMFQLWAKSQGSSYPDWYRDKPGYKNNALLFYEPED
ncbi:MAG: LruC domain-containing protein [Bacteroidota bacterium]